MHPAVRNRRETSWSDKLVSVGGAVAGTAILVVVLIVLFDPPGLIRDGYAATSEATAIDLETSCEGDVLLATSLRVARCLSPWHDDTTERCSEDAWLIMWMDISACNAPAAMPAPIAVLDARQQRALDKLTPIDPEPLLEDLQPKPPDHQPPPPPQPAQQQPPPPPPPPQQQRPSQVVEVAKPSQEQEPDHARLVSDVNVKVDKQTVARGARNEPMIAKSKPEELTPKDKPKDEPSIQKPPDKPPGANDRAPNNPNPLAMRPPGTPTPATAAQDEIARGSKGSKGPIVSDGFIPRRGDGAVQQARRDPGELTPGQGGGGGGTPPVPNLKPSKEQLERIVGGGSVDHLDDVESGDETALSAKRWIYASFFNRLKRQVAQNWDPQSVWRRTDPTGTHNGFKTRVTEVRVVLSAKGELQDIVVTKGSEVHELDDEAIRAFHAASPFPNPPDGLATNGKIAFAFSFFFEIGQARTQWRAIRTN